MREHRLGEIDPENITDAYQQEVFDALQIGFTMLVEHGYDYARQHGLIRSKGKSAGLLIACTQLVAHHLMQHSANLLLDEEQVQVEVDAACANIKTMVTDHYKSALNHVANRMAEEATKQ